MGPPTIQLQVRRIDAERFRDARPGAGQEQQEHAITPATRRALIRGVDEGVQLSARQDTGHLGVRALDGDGQDPLGNAD